MHALNLPNIITLTRIFAAPLIMVLMYLPQYPGPVMNWVLVILFAIAALTDLIDGRLARERGEVTAMGKFLDPLADKILIGTVLIMFVRFGLAPAWVVVLILCRELAVTGVRAVAVEQGVVMAADRYGKWKTVLQCLACGCLLHNGMFLGIDWGVVGTFLLYVALILTVFSGGNYLYKFYRNLLEEDNR